MAHTPGRASERRELRDPITGRRMVALTAEPAHHWPLTAPDTPLTPAGDYLLFLSDRGGAPHANLFRLEMRTGIIEPVTDTDRLVAGGITPAANGRQAIALLRGEEGEVVAIDLETGEWETLAVFLDAQLEGCHRSASGEYVVTVVTQQDEAVITAVHTEGMRTVPILEAPRGVHAARFSPDSKNSVLYVRDEPPEVRCVEFDGTGDRLLWSGLNTTSAIWRGSGEEVVFIPGEGAGPILAAPRQGGPPRGVSSLPCAWIRSDGRGEQLVASVVDGNGAKKPLSYGIVLLDARSGDAAPLVSGCSDRSRPCFSPDGQSVVYASRDDQGFTQLYQVDLQEE